jgi:hypothetical protein
VETPLLYRLWALADRAFLPLLLAGGAGAALGWRGGGYILLVAVFGRIGAHLLVSSVHYRRVMQSRWPPVAPLHDDTWDEWRPSGVGESARASRDRTRRSP